MTTKVRTAVLVFGLLAAGTVAARADSHFYRLYVDGLACPFCAYGIEKKVGGLAVVEKVEIDIDGGVVKVTVRNGEKLEETAAKRAVAEAGFTLRKFESPRKE